MECGSQNWLLKLYRVSRSIAVVKTGMTTLHRFSTVLEVVKTSLGNIYRPSNAFAAVNPLTPKLPFGYILCRKESLCALCASFLH